MPHRKHRVKEEKTGTTAPEKTGPRRSVDEYSEVMRNEQPTDGIWKAFLPKPRKLSVDILSEHEQIILVMRQHPITQLKWFLLVIIMFFLPMLFSSSGIFDFLPGRYQFAAGLGWYLLTFGLIVESFLKWFYHVYIITDERVIDVDFISLIYKDISTTKIDNIEDITSINAGFFSSLVDYGTVIIQTAATKQELRFENVPHPSKVTALLNDLILEEELEKFEGRVV
ncbi:MAG: hypothetical protein BroJett025_09910 [Patescibacteria group bacterium]|nr:MAG: hypothetical protein BroJett025_09910 [Patescibacteria group bacterium]